MKLALVIHRYGSEVAGGSEAHARGLARALRKRHHVEVFTTCAHDYVSWRNHYPPGEIEDEGVRVHRFPCARERDEKRFASMSDLVFHDEHLPDDEEEWLRENGPYSPALVSAVAARSSDFDAFLVYSYRYFSAAASVRSLRAKTILIPTAEDDPAIKLPMYRDVFAKVEGVLYLTPEEQALVEEHFPATRSKPTAVIGSGLEVVTPEALPRAVFQLGDSYVLYAGRLDRNKGVDTLFRYYLWLAESWPECPTLALSGHQVLDVPNHPKIRYLGYVTPEQKASLIDGALVVLMPSPYESLSMIALEAWALGKPVLANATCRVLEGQCLRSNGGLFYRDFAEFDRMLRRLVRDEPLRRALGKSGADYVRANYSWDLAAERTEDVLGQVVGGKASR